MEALSTTLDDQFVVFHSVAWHANSRKPDGEADFLIGHPDLGFLAVEVKGGAIDFDASKARWTSRDRHGETFPIKDPFTQALNAKHELVRELLDDGRWPRGRRVQMGYVVMFPDMVITSSGFTSRGKREILLGKNDLPVLGNAIKDRLGYWQTTDPGEPPGAVGVDAAVQRFGRSWTYRGPAPRCDRARRAADRRPHRAADGHSHRPWKAAPSGDRWMRRFRQELARHRQG